jgi:hypothetical protein
MVMMTDTEHPEVSLAETAGDEYLYDVDLCDFGAGPAIYVGVPDADGYATCLLRNVLEEYHDNGYASDGFEFADEFVAYLRDYANRLESKVKKEKT